jgi:hypothetical protein
MKIIRQKVQAIENTKGAIKSGPPDTGQLIEGAGFSEAVH